MNLNILRGLRRFLILSFILVLAGVSLNGTVFGKSLKVGFIDMELLRTELPYYQELENIFKAKDAELESFRGSLYKEYLQFYQQREQNYLKEKTGRSSEEQERLSQRFQTEVKAKMAQLNEQLEKRQGELEKFKEEQNQMLIDKVNELINTVSAKAKVATVIEKKYVFYGGTDITKKVIDKVKKDSQKKTKP